ncbi:MAG: hypothetical protein MZV63_34600 [Marinilabiliales bacterium]|nr:hypothetical protein [Marinilabiliales bacterium]
MSPSTAPAQRRSVRSFSVTDSISMEQLSQLVWAAQGKTGTRGRRTSPRQRAPHTRLKCFVLSKGLPAPNLACTATTRSITFSFRFWPSCRD